MQNEAGEPRKEQDKLCGCVSNHFGKESSSLVGTEAAAGAHFESPVQHHDKSLCKSVWTRTQLQTHNFITATEHSVASLLDSSA